MIVCLSWPSPPDLFEYKFVNSRLVNSTFLHNKEGCPLDVTGTGEGAYMVYFVSFLGTLAVLPGNIVSALLMDKIGRLRMLGKGERLGRELTRRPGVGMAVTGLLTLVCGKLSQRRVCVSLLLLGGSRGRWRLHDQAGSGEEAPLGIGGGQNSKSRIQALGSWVLNLSSTAF